MLLCNMPLKEIKPSITIVRNCKNDCIGIISSIKKNSSSNIDAAIRIIWCDIDGRALEISAPHLTLNDVEVLHILS